MYLNGNLKKKKKEKKIFTELENERYVDANERSWIVFVYHLHVYDVLY